MGKQPKAGLAMAPGRSAGTRPERCSTRARSGRVAAREQGALAVYHVAHAYAHSEQQLWQEKAPTRRAANSEDIAQAAAMQEESLYLIHARNALGSQKSHYAKKSYRKLVTDYRY